MSSMLRGLARNRAKTNMRAKGFTRICSDDRRLGSLFASEWRNYARPMNIRRKSKV